MNDSSRAAPSPASSSPTSSPNDSTDASAASCLILASASPRRREILTEAGIRFVSEPSGVDETPRPDEGPAALVERLAREKALDIARRLAGGPPRPVLGADTIVVLDGEILGKPSDARDAVRMLSRLVGRSHEVMTGIALAWTDDRAIESQVVTSRVEMRSAWPQEIVDYVALGESLDKAGGYALQGGASRFVTRVVGSRTNVIGLPREETIALLHRGGADAKPEPERG